ncbi:MAG: hypothetical protein QXR96_01060 [Candidatus Woesearchaeota archaeon]
MNLKAKVIKIHEIKEFVKFGVKNKIAVAIIKDLDSEKEFKLNLWNDQIDLIKENETIEIFNAYEKKWQNQIYLNVNIYGKILRKN